MLDRARKAFLAHPDSVGESYFEHMGAALRYAGTFAYCAFCAFVHAFLPFLFEKTASTTVRKMVADMDARMGAPAAAPHGKVTPGAQAAE